MKLSVFILLASAASAQTFCEPGSGLSFDGAGQRVMVPYDSSFPVDVFTLAAWVRTSGQTTGGFIVRGVVLSYGEDGTSGNGPWFLSVEQDGQFLVRIEDTADFDWTYGSGVAVDDSRWHHIAATRDAAATLRFYLDGALVATHPNTATPSPDSDQFLTIGCTLGVFGPPPPPPFPVMFYEGEIDEPAVWNVALSPAQIADVQALGVDPASPGLVGHWSFDEGAGQQVLDSSPFSNHGFLGSSSTTPDSSDPSWVAVPITCTFGCGDNPPGSLRRGAGLPAVGAPVVLELDNPLGTQSPGSLSFVAVSAGPLASPCGVAVPGWGMAGADGYLLVDPAPPNFFGVLVGPAWGGPGSPASLTLALPNLPSLAGASVFTQGLLWDAGATSGPEFGLSEALELFIGP